MGKTVDLRELEMYTRALALRINAVETIFNDVVSALVVLHPNRAEIIAGLDQYRNQDRDTAAGDTFATVAENFIEVIEQRDSSR